MNLRASYTGAVLAILWQHVRAALATATVTRLARRVAGRAATATRRSRVAALIRWTGRAAQGSWLYRWLTAEPETEVVVIDLRETVIIGPLLGVLDAVLEPLVSHWQEGVSGRLLARLREEFLAGPVQLASTAACVAVLTVLLFLVAVGSPSSTGGVLLVLLAPALAGTRVRLSADELGDELADANVTDWLAALLAPPEPPESDGPEQ